MVRRLIADNMDRLINIERLPQPCLSVRPTLCMCLSDIVCAHPCCICICGCIVLRRCRVLTCEWKQQVVFELGRQPHEFLTRSTCSPVSTSFKLWSQQLHKSHQYGLELLSELLTARNVSTGLDDCFSVIYYVCGSICLWLSLGIPSQLVSTEWPWVATSTLEWKTVDGRPL